MCHLVFFHNILWSYVNNMQKSYCEYSQCNHSYGEFCKRSLSSYLPKMALFSLFCGSNIQMKKVIYNIYWHVDYVSNTNNCIFCCFLSFQRPLKQNETIHFSLEQLLLGINALTTKCIFFLQKCENCPYFKNISLIFLVKDFIDYITLLWRLFYDIPNVILWRHN